MHNPAVYPQRIFIYICIYAVDILYELELRAGDCIYIFAVVSLIASTTRLIALQVVAERYNCWIFRRSSFLLPLGISGFQHFIDTLMGVQRKFCVFFFSFGQKVEITDKRDNLWL